MCESCPRSERGLVMRCLVICSCLGITVGAVGFASDLPRKVKPVVVWTGIDTKQPKDLFTRSCSPKEWQMTWKRHCGPGKETAKPKCPRVDFSSVMVIALFCKTSRIRLQEVVEEKKCIRVRFQGYGNQIIFSPSQPPNDKEKVGGIELGRGELDLDKPYLLSYAFIVLPRSNKPVVIEKDVQARIGDLPVWKELGKFPAIMDK